MFDKNTLIGMGLILVLLFGYTYYTQPTKEEIAASQHKKDSITMLKKNIAIIDSLKLITPKDTVGTTANKTNYNGLFNGTVADEKFVLENDLISISLNSKGGHPTAVLLKEYKTSKGFPFQILNNKNDYWELEFNATDQTINTKNIYFQKIESTPTSLLLRAYADSQKTKYIQYKYNLKPNNYLVDFEITLEKMEELIPRQAGYFNFNWVQTLQVAEHDISMERTNSTIYFKEEEVDYLSETKNEVSTELRNASWLSYKQQFFNNTLINKSGFEEGKTSLGYITDDTTYLKKCESKLVMRYDNAATASYPMQWYIGPNNYKELKLMGIELQRILPFGWGIFGWCNKYFILPLFSFLQNIFSSYGLIILMLTIIIKLITFPLTYKSYVASAKMKLLKPEIDKLKARYKDDPQTLQMEQMKVQSKSGVNPLGGCLPQLVQMPVWIALYRFFPASIEFRQQPFLWASDLSNFDSIFQIAGYHISLFCVLFCISQLLMTWYMTKTTDIPDQMKYMQYFFPFMMFFFLNSTSAGLNWYLFAGNIVTFILQYVSLNYIIDTTKLQNQMEENKKKPAKKSLFQQKMEEAVKQRQSQSKK